MQKNCPDQTVRENALATAHWLDVCASEYCSQADDWGCAGCPYLGGACGDGLMQDAAKVLAALYPRGQVGYQEAQKLIVWLGRCVADDAFLRICEDCPYINGCPSGLLSAAADLIRAACNKRRRAL